ncbi:MULTISPECIES: hypothetical protein [Enterococcus]|uniref:hypothetical protein n=1 Tax=Enterococcus TaxID=1350 RepID=UPI000E5388B9|nr:MULTISPECIES: hypothetical protein [Enterococcus]MDU1987922.1 hypothetical protein [Enterococcus faecalis]MDO0919780.1 hypothetical protein [Enterococcus sp. B1E2]MDU5812500.1 hypothetical protein [Enterococcus casseliflavus]QOG29932.1 hypothetical protein EGM182_03460 [Enterococcus casseliflavus]RHH54041.1 hypothetical protein DW201_13510 [Enterococcus casseliflavus]
MQGEEIGAMRRTKKNSQTKDTTRKKYIFYIGIFFCISLIYVYVNSYFLVSGADFDFHTSRIIGLANSLENNHWFPKINYYMANGLGYGTPMFYGEWFLYIPAILIVFFNFSVVQSWMALYVCFYTGSLTILFFTAKKFELSDFRAFSFSALIIFNSLMATIVNGAIAFAICLVLLPLLLYYLYQLFYFEKTNIAAVSIIAAIIVNTHILSTMVVALICLLFFFLNIRRVNGKVMLALMKTILLTVGFSAFFLLPLLEQKASQELIAFHTPNAFRYTSVKGIGTILFNSLNDNVRTISNFPTLSAVGVILLTATLRKFDMKPSLLRDLSFLIFALIILGSNMFPWIEFSSSSLGAVQFVGRYLVFALILIILLSVLNHKIPNYLFVFCIVLTIFLGISRNTFPDFTTSDNPQEVIILYNSPEYEQKKLNRYEDLNAMRSGVEGKSVVLGVSGGEYLNIGADPSNLSTNGEPTIKNGQIVGTDKSYGKIKIQYTIDNEEKKAEIVVPLLWYKGYVANYSKGAKGSQPNLLLSETTGKALEDGKITLLAEKSGSVEIYYAGTLIQKLSACLSVFLVLLVLTFKIRRKVMAKK